MLKMDNYYCLSYKSHNKDGDRMDSKETHGMKEFADLNLLLCNSHNRRFDSLLKE